MTTFAHPEQGLGRAHPRIRVLVVEENGTALAVMGRRLSHYGHDVVLAENGFVALAKMNARQFDIILVDMDMAMMTGRDTIRKMRGSGLLSGAAILALTGGSDAAAVIEALEAGADDQIVKPFEFAILDARIRHNVGRARQVGELARFNQQLDARIARRAVELGEARAELADLEADRMRLMTSIQSLHDQLERLNARGA